MRRFWFWSGSLSLLGLLAACGVGPASKPPGQSDEYVLTVSVGPGDTQEGVLQQYGGQALSWHPEEGFAILKLSAEEKARLSGEVSIQAVPNSTLEAPEASVAGHSAWGGGVGAWGGGINAWSGAWGAWGGGTTNLPVLPAENRYAWTQIQLPHGQAVSKNFGQGIKVAVIDTGLDTAHPMFSGRLAPAVEWKDYVGGDSNPAEVSGGSAYGHGTAVAGIILQIAPKATILPIRVLDQNGVGDVANVVLAIEWALQKGAKVINLSLGTNVDVSALKTQIDYATKQRVYVVASAGNEASGTTLTYPAQYATTGTNRKYVISVGSVKADNNTSGFCNKGAALEIMSPGENLYTAYPGNQAVSATGTSFATPVIAGAVTLAYADTATNNRGNLEKHLLDSGRPNSENRKVISVLGGLLKLPDFTAKQALMVVYSASSPDSSDRVLKTRLENLGYIVTLKQDSVSTASDATGKDIVLISESVDTADVGSKFRDVAVPVMVWENGIYGDMKMTGININTDFADMAGQNQVAISNTAHPLAAGLSGNQTVYTAADWMAWGVPGSGAVKAATLASNPNRAAIFGYDKNATMMGMIAPARRVGFFFSDYSANNLSGQGGTLFDAAVTWAVSGN